MKTVFILLCVFGIALCVPVPVVRQPQAIVPSPVQAVSPDQTELARKRRFIDVDVYNFGNDIVPQCVSNDFL